MDALRFELLPDVVPALDALAAAGLRLGVVSNWDCGLRDVLDGLGIADRFAAVSASAVVGAASRTRRSSATPSTPSASPPAGPPLRRPARVRLRGRGGRGRARRARRPGRRPGRGPCPRSPR